METHELRNDLRLILQVRIHQNQRIAGCIIERGPKRGLAPEVARKRDDLDTGIVPSSFLED